ncbi:aldolase [Exidia glandulosa HHB12029]|uniref:Aldolase n=1 Tax=Exidia glandulosa HHB12029 TaxID=1314781 RepID=A0A165BI36_EXIGL|nr:aldolase [Exidia glandulosa HHB12029]
MAATAVYEAAPRPPPAGIYVPAVLFFTPDDELDLAAISEHVLRLARGGVTGILVQGSNGEAQHLSHDERSRAIRHTRKTLDDAGFCHVRIMAGTGAQSTRETRTLCEEAKDAGAEWALVLTPSTWVPAMSPDAIIRFHREVAQGSPIPTLIYNFPVVTAGIDLDSDVLGTLAQETNIVGVKLSCGQIGKLSRLTTQNPLSKFSPFIGRADVLLPSLQAGSAGGILALANIAPRACVKLFKSFKNGDLEEARKLQDLFVHADWAITKLGGIGGVKAIVTRGFGYGSGLVRGPLTPASEQKLQQTAGVKWLDELVALEKSLPDVEPGQ